MLCVTDVHLHFKEHILSSFALECESSKHLLFLLGLFVFCFVFSFVGVGEDSFKTFFFLAGGERLELYTLNRLSNFSSPV